MAIKAAWETAKGLGRAYLKYQKGKVRKGPLGYVDMVEKDILKTHEPGSKWVKEYNPIPLGKKIVKTSIAAPFVVTGVVKGTEKIKKKLKERKDKKPKKERTWKGKIHQRGGPGKAEGGRIGFKRGKD